MTKKQMAPGAPGIAPRWTSSAKEGVGTAFSQASRVWFTHSHGILNEVYYPGVDQACIRDLGLIITDGQEYFCEEKRHTKTRVEYLQDGVPGYRIKNECPDFVIEKALIADPGRDVIVQKVQFRPSGGSHDRWRLHVLLAPHLGNNGSNNTAWVDDYKGVPFLFAERDGIALALGCSRGFSSSSAGYVGVSDGWQDLQRHKQLTWSYRRAEDGNVALVGEIPLEPVEKDFSLALGFGRSFSEAALLALGSLNEDFGDLRQRYVSEWSQWLEGLAPLLESCPEQRREPCRKMLQLSTATIRTHEEKRFPGGIIASLSIPWGFSKGDDDLGGYHLTWPRDLVEAGGALIAAGAGEDALRVLGYLQSTQESDGHWAQNMWLDGRAYWSGVQMDETALPILLVDLAYRHDLIARQDLTRLLPMLRRAAGYLVLNGPMTPEDRWEEDPGYAPFTLASEITALLAAADMLEEIQPGEDSGHLAGYLRETADVWFSEIDHWLYARDTELCAELGVEGYYVRISPPDTEDAETPLVGEVPIRNRGPGSSSRPATQIVSTDALALVRFGLRAPDDPRILNTLRIIDHLLRVEFSQGPCWYRYNEDGYGEHEDGEPYDGTGVGRPWPLLTGERAHYELAAGNLQEAEQLLQTLADFAGPTGLLPEQVWDAADVPEAELFRGKPSGSAMPLIWAHAEYIKLLRSLRDGQVFDTPPQGIKRYLEEQHPSRYQVWRFSRRRKTLSVGKTLRLEALAAGIVHWTVDAATWRQTSTRDTGVGVFVADLDTAQLSRGAEIEFTWFWPEAERWEEKHFRVSVV